jgi:hypothetical protein
MIAMRTITRIQDADDLISVPGAGTDGQALVWDQAASGFGMAALAANDDGRYVAVGNQGTYQLHGCVLRSNAGTWQILTDANHAPLGFSGGVSQSASAITLAYGVTATKVITCAISPDEAYAARFAFGASVGLSTLTINAYRQSQVAHRQWLCTKQDTAPYFSVSNFGGGSLPAAAVSWNAGELTIQHNAGETLNGVALYDPMGWLVQPRNGRNTVTYTHTYVKFYDLAGTQITDPATFPTGYRFMLERADAAPGYVSLNPAASELQVASSNIWVAALLQV